MIKQLENNIHPLAAMIKNKFEIAAHVIFWIFIMSSINVEWTANWFDMSIRPNHPAPLSVVMFAVFFYVNTFVLLPKYFSRQTWKDSIPFYNNGEVVLEQGDEILNFVPTTEYQSLKVSDSESADFLIEKSIYYVVDLKSQSDNC